MAVRLTRKALVLVDSEPQSQAALDMANQHAKKVVVLATVNSKFNAGETEVVRSLSAEPSMTEVLRTAAERHIPLVVMRRDIAPPETLLSELILAAGRAATNALPGFAVMLAPTTPRALGRILMVIDRGTGPITGFMVFIAERIAQRAGAEVDVLVLSAPGEDISASEESEAVLVNREAELYSEALSRAAAANLAINWITAEGGADKWEVIRDQLAGNDYDLIIDEIGDLSIRGALRSGITVEQALEPGQVGEISLRLLRQTEVPLLLVLDDVRLGINTGMVAKMAAVAAAALTVVSGGLVGSGAGHASSEAGAAASSTDLLSQAGDVAGEIEQAQQSVDAAQARAKKAKGASRSATKTTKVKVVKPKAPKGGADRKDVVKAQTAEKKERKQFQKAKDALARAEKAEGKANDQLAKAQDELDASALELQAAQQALTEAQAELGHLQEASSGLPGLVSGGASEEELAAAEKAVVDAQLWIERATARGEQALSDLQRATAKEDKSDNALSKATASYTQARTEFETSQAKSDVYEASYEKALAAERARLAKLKRAPVAKGHYHFTARFGQAGSHWSSGYHTGLDFAGPVGTDVTAAKSGTVISAGWAGAYGNHIEIQHADGIVTTYSHLSAINVSPGEKVSTGEKIGDMGSTGNSTGPHLHFEVKKNGNLIDPESWLGL